MNKRIVLITGAAGGLGSALAEEFARSGADLLLVDTNLKGLEALSDQLVEIGLPEPGICELDLAKAGASEFAELAAILERAYGALDVFVHCAAEFEGLRPLEHTEEQQWEIAFRVNAMAAWRVTFACAGLLKRSVRGAVVLVHDDPGISAAAYWGAYGVSKAALTSLGQIMKEELEGAGIAVLHVTPKPMRTALRAKAYLAEDPGTLAEPREEAAKIARLVNQSYSEV